MIAFADENFILKMVNPAYCNWVGLAKNEIENKTIHDLFPEKIADKIYNEYGSILKTGRDETRVIKLYPGYRNEQGAYSIDRKKPVIWFYEIKTPVYNKEGDIIGVLAILRDITQLKKTELDLKKAKENLEIKVRKRTLDLVRQNTLLETEIDLRKKTEKKLIDAKKDLERVNKLKDEFLGYISHEIRTPLGLITMCLQSLVELEGLSNEDKNIEQIYRSVESSVKIIDEVLDISQIEAGEFVVIESAFNLKNLVDEIVEEFQHQIKRKKLDISLHVDNMSIISDARRIKQVLTNLVSNAIKYSLKGKITIKAKLNKSILSCSVKDNGIGISPENIDDIFDPLFRENRTDLHAKGMGLGLDICKKIIKSLNGEITVESELGKGSKFKFEIPVKLRKKEGKNEL
jgi:PAS domain S-box-containing protein